MTLMKSKIASVLYYDGKLMHFLLHVEWKENGKTLL